MRVHFFGPAPRIPLTPENSVEHCFASVGGNTGNMLFAHALERQIKFSEATFGYSFDPRDINENVGLVVIPAANWLQVANEQMIIAWHGILSATKVPFLLVGLGSQASRYSELPTLPPAIVSFLAMVSERSKSIGTRGEFSTAVMEKHGFKNTRTVGCPSLYTLCVPEFPRVKDVRSVRMSHLVLQGTRHTIFPLEYYDFDPLQRLERKLFNYGNERGLYNVLQSEIEEIPILAKGPNHDHADRDKVKRVLDYYGALSMADLEGFFKRSRVFFDVDEWMAFLRPMDLVCGSRLHGCVAAVNAGTRACLLTHDTRTQEIADLSGMPNRPLREFVELVEATNFQAAIQRVNAESDFEPFYKKYGTNYRRYIDFFEENGVEHDLVTGVVPVVAAS